jgi:hypothetical protein
MKPIDTNLKATGWTKVIYAKDQPEYLPLPVIKNPNGDVISCWSLDWKERIKLFLTGKLWLMILTYNHPLQPILPTVNKFKFEKTHE